MSRACSGDIIPYSRGWRDIVGLTRVLDNGLTDWFRAFLPFWWVRYRSGLTRVQDGNTVTPSSMPTPLCFNCTNVLKSSLAFYV